MCYALSTHALMDSCDSVLAHTLAASPSRLQAQRKRTTNGRGFRRAGEWGRGGRKWALGPYVGGKGQILGQKVQGIR